MSEVSGDIDKKLGDAVEKMPAFPRSVQRVLELTRKIDSPPKELVAVIEKDPVMTMKILRVINSAFYSLPNKVTSINHSLVYLGLNTVKNLALSIAAVGILPRTNQAGFDVQNYLLHSLTTASLARAVSSRYAAGEVDPGDCYIAGLLHDFGKVVFAQFMPIEFQHALEQVKQRALPLHQAEMETIGADHTVVGSLLAERWQFPPSLVESIRHHHNPTHRHNAMGDCLRMANQICRYKEVGNSGNPYRENEAAIAPARFGVDLDDVIAEIGDFDQLVIEASVFAQVDAGANA